MRETITIQGAKEQGFLREEALANELAGEFYLRGGTEKVGCVKPSVVFMRSSFPAFSNERQRQRSGKR